MKAQRPFSEKLQDFPGKKFRPTKRTIYTLKNGKLVKKEVKMP